MKICSLKQLKIFFGLSLFLVSVFYSVGSVSAMTEAVSITQSSSNTYNGTDGEIYQIITAVNDSISTITVNCDFSSTCLRENTDASIYICEATSATDPTCLDTPVQATGVGYYYATWLTVNGGEGYHTTVGHYYRINLVIHTGYVSYSNANPYAGGKSNTGANDDLRFVLYQNSDYVAPPASNFQIAYTGIGIEKPETNNNRFRIPYFWNVCTGYNDIIYANLYAWFEQGEGVGGETRELISPDLIGPQLCRGSGVYETAIPEELTLDSGTAYFQMDVYGSSTPLTTSTSTSFNFVILDNPDNFLYESGDYPLVIDNLVGTSTKLLFYYNFEGLNWASSSVCLYNDTGGTDGNGADTSYCYTPTADHGIGYVYLPHTQANFTFYGRWHANITGGDDFLSFKQISIIFKGAFNPSIPNLLGTSTRDFVCSHDEWNATSTYLGLNLTTFKCGVFYTVVSVAEKIGDKVKSIASGVGSGLSYVFPLSLPAKFYDSWQQSASSTIPAQLDWLAIADQEGNIYLSWPAELSENGTTTQIQVWGDIFTPAGSTSATIFAGIRYLTGLLYWLALIIGLWKTGEWIKNDIH